MTAVDVPSLMGLVSHLAFVALGLGVLVAAPRRAANRGFALYAIGVAAPPLAIHVSSFLGPFLPLAAWPFYWTTASHGGAT